MRVVMAKKRRRHRHPDAKLAVLREQAVDRKPVSDGCERHGIQGSLFHCWQRQLFEDGATPFAPPSRAVASRDQKQAERIERPEAKLARKGAVIAEISEDLVQTR